MLGAPGNAHAEMKQRYQGELNGDFALIGNTLAQDCRSTTPRPLVGKMPSINTWELGEPSCYQKDTSPDFFWTLDDWTREDTGATTIPYLPPYSPADSLQARSRAILTLPSDAKVTYARLYWAATRFNTVAGDQVAAPDLTATLSRPGVAGFENPLTADDHAFEYVPGNEYQYQSTADITSIVKAYGAGAYQVSDVQAIPVDATAGEYLFDAWWMVVFYERPGQPRRYMALFDGLEEVASGGSTGVTVSGFYVPFLPVEAKLGVVAFEGDPDEPDVLIVNDRVIGNDLNPANNFFNSTRSWTTRSSEGVRTDTPLAGVDPGTDGVLDSLPFSDMGDRPQLTGTAGSISGMDLDVVDVTVAPGDRSVKVDVRSAADKFWLGGFITSITTQAPDFTNTIKAVRNLTSTDGMVRVGDVIEYTITTQNTGDDHSRATVLTDALPAQLDYVPGSLQLLTVAASDTLSPGSLTDVKGDDVGHYDAATRTLTVYLGTGATPTNGGSLRGNVGGSTGESTSISFQMRVTSTTVDKIDNQAIIRAGGMLGIDSVETKSRPSVCDAVGPTSIPVPNRPSFRLDFTNTIKAVRNLTSTDGTVRPGDVIEYTITTQNTGNDHSRDTVLTDPLPTQLDYVPGSLRLLTVAASDTRSPGSLTDAKGDDVGHYDAATRTLTVYLGTGAMATSGGSLKGNVGESTSISFQMRVKPTTVGKVNNQATVRAGGMLESESLVEAKSRPVGVCGAVGPTSITVSSEPSGPSSPSVPLLDTPPHDAYVGTKVPVYAGTADKDNTVYVSLNGEQLCAVSSDASSGSWSCESPHALEEGGPYTVSVYSKDSRGSSSQPTQHRFYVDTVAPAPLVSTPTPEAWVTSSTPTLTGLVERYSTLTLAVDGKAYAPILVTAEGTWSFTPPESLPEGPHSLSVTATDRAGNTGSTSLSWSQDTLLPESPLIQEPKQGTRLFTRTPTFSGNAEPGSTVMVLLNGAQLGTVQAGADGAWSLKSSFLLGAGEHRASAWTKDAAGNVSAVSPEVPFSTSVRSLYGSNCAAVPTAPEVWPWALLLLGLSRRRRISE
ncbi:Ig-like domain-containing protein [Archangium sp.]|uniref:Ig-like domain-containing protein n=1 Tax=Archangium sp. TaxID=1872627 RepID=UPI002ED809B0